MPPQAAMTTISARGRPGEPIVQ